MQTDVSACNTAGAPLLTQPVVEARDDGGNVIQCASGPVTAAIVPGTGTLGASLFGTNPEALVSGVASYTDLGIDLPGRRYRLSFGHPDYPAALSRSFSQGVSVAISGPASACVGETPTYTSPPRFDRYEWRLDGTIVSTLPNLTLAGLAAGTYALDLTVEQDTCPATDSKLVNIFPTLTGVTISATPPTTVCDTCLGGTATVTDIGGGTATHQWGYRLLPGGTITPIAGATGSSYVINGADFPGPNNYLLVVTTTPTCGSAQVSNEIDVQVAPSTSEVQVLAVTSRSNENVVQWVNPGGGPYVETEIWYDSGPSGCTYPSAPGIGTLLTAQANGLGAKDAVVHPGLINGDTYCYAAFVQTSVTPTFSFGRFTRGRPFDTTGPVKWAYSTGAAAVAAPGPGATSVVAVSNDRVLHAMQRGAAGGIWPASWMPLILNGPAQSRPPVVRTTAVPGSSRVAFVGSQDGYVYAVDADSGAPRWQSAVRLGDMVQASPAGIFQAFGASVDQILVGSRNSLADNEFFALNVSDGTVVGTPFDNGGGPNSIGIISSSAAVDYARNQVFFTSRSKGSPDTLWALDISAGGLSYAWSSPLGNIDGAVIPRGDALYVGNNIGRVYTVDAATGATLWNFDTSDGAVKGFVFADPFSTNLYFATTNKVWGLTDGVGSNWLPVTSIPDPSVALYKAYSTHIYVGSSNGKLYQIDFAGASPGTSPALTSLPLGDGLAAVGAPAIDYPNNMIYVGTDAGIIYAVQLPLP